MLPSQHLPAFADRVHLGLTLPSSPSSSQPVAGSGRPKRSVSNSLEPERACGACPEDVPAALTPRDARLLGPGPRSRRPPAAGRTQGRAPARPSVHLVALGAASPAQSPPEAGPARRLPTGAARPAHARRAAGRAGHPPPTHSVSLSLPALAPSPSGVSQSLPVAAGDFSASPFLPSPRRSLGLSGEGAAERESD